MFLHGLTYFLISGPGQFDISNFRFTRGFVYGVKHIDCFRTIDYIEHAKRP